MSSYPWSSSLKILKLVMAVTINKKISVKINRCKWKWRMIIAVNFPIWAIGKKKPEKNQGFYGIRTHDLCDTGAILYQLSYKATHWEGDQFIEFMSPVRKEMTWSIYEINAILLSRQ